MFKEHTSLKNILESPFLDYLSFTNIFKKSIFKILPWVSKTPLMINPKPQNHFLHFTDWEKNSIFSIDNQINS